MVQKIIDLDRLQPHVVKRCLTGGDLLPVRLVQNITSRTSIKLYNLYGTSETGVFSIATASDLAKHPDTIGKIISGITSKIIDDKGNSLPSGCVGELLVNCKWSSDIRSNQFVATGDLMYKNQEGFYFYKGRKDDRMVIGGENIYPIELESIIYAHPSISWVKVSPFVDENENTRIQVELVIKEARAFVEEDFSNWLKARIPSYMWPKSIIVIQEFVLSKLM